MQLDLDGAAQGVGTIPRRRRLNALLAIAAIAAILSIVVIAATMVALLVWVEPLGRSGVGAEDAIPKAGSAIVHDEAGNLNSH